MDNNKLQELTDKLYREGLEKGQKEGESRLSAAKKEAEQIVASANEKAQQIITSANKEAEEIRKNAEAEIKMAFRQSFLSVRQQVEQMLVAKAISEPVKKGIMDEEFVMQLLLSIAKSFEVNGESVALSAVLPDSMKSLFENKVQNTVSAVLNAGVDVSFDKQVKAGFKIGPKDEGYFISFTDKDFENLLREYLRPYLTSLLFGGK